MYRTTEVVLMDAEWLARAACRGSEPSLFFPSDGAGVERARRVCRSCAVRGDCLEYALKERLTFGVFGGCSERERERILRTRFGARRVGRPALHEAS